MTRAELAPEVLDDFDRFIEHWTRFEVPDASARIADIVQGIQILTNNPRVGRPVAGGKRELVIGQGGRGYVALYRFVPRIDTVFVLAIRNQREAGYHRDA